MNIVVCLFPLTAVLPEKHDDGQQAEDLSHAIQLSSLKYDFIPCFNFPGEDQLKLLYKTKLLGVTIISDLTFTRHVEEINKKVTKIMWLTSEVQRQGCQQG